MDFQTVLAVQLAEHGLGRGMLDFGDLPDVLDPGIDDAVLVVEELRQVAAGDVAVLVYRGGEHRAAVTLEPRRVVGSPAEERDAKRRARDDHSAAVNGES